MKVTVCPICRITPDITNTELKCPKCGRTSKGKDLNETVANWNNGVVTDGKAPKVVIKDEEVLKEEIKEEIEAPAEEEMPSPKKTIRKKAEKPVKKPVKKGKEE